jgi:hypothetical protein
MMELKAKIPEGVLTKFYKSLNLRDEDAAYAAGTGFMMKLPFFEHILSIQYPPIQDFSLWGDDLYETTHKLEALEDDFKALSDGIVAPDPRDEIIFWVNKTMAWLNLNRAGCEAEGSAMGHCGNGAGRNGETVLSLRTKEAGGWRPHLTFIMDDRGFLGEMKGRGNSKPNERYHPHIVALLLKYREIKGMRPDLGYLPENNFHFDDLSDALKKKVQDARPDILPLTHLVFGPDTPTVRARIQSHLMGGIVWKKTIPESLRPVDSVNQYIWISEMCVYVKNRDFFVKKLVDAAVWEDEAERAADALWGAYQEWKEHVESMFKVPFQTSLGPLLFKRDREGGKMTVYQPLGEFAKYYAKHNAFPRKVSTLDLLPQIMHEIEHPNEKVAYLVRVLSDRVLGGELYSLYLDQFSD